MIISLGHICEFTNGNICPASDVYDFGIMLDLFGEPESLVIAILDTTTNADNINCFFLELYHDTIFGQTLDYLGAYGNRQFKLKSVITPINSSPEYYYIIFDGT